MDPETAAVLAQLREAGAFMPGSLPQTGFGMPDLSILRGQGAIPGIPLQQGGNPLANYPQARQPGGGFGAFIDRSAPELVGPIVEAGKAAVATAAPGLTAFGLGMMPTPAGGQSKPTEETRQLQQFLKDRGYFKWTVDG